MSLNAVCEDVRSLMHAAGKGSQGVDLFSMQWGSANGGGEIHKQFLKCLFAATLPKTY